jgi:hypothetical protein
MCIGFVALETFIPTDEYKQWSKLFHLEEVVTLDCALCPSLIVDVDSIGEFQEQWQLANVFTDLNWVLQKVKDVKDKQILAIIREPEEDCRGIDVPEGFEFYGYDLIEDDTQISALTNCGGFDKTFSSSDLSRYGLIEDFSKAKAVQLRLEENYPDESHANCTLWAIWRMVL